MIRKYNLNIVDNGFDITEFKPYINNVFSEVIKELNINYALALSVVFNNDKIQLELNKKYRNKNYLPDVLSFYLGEEDNIDRPIKIIELGDIFISYNKAVEQSKKYNHSLKREISFLFLHGFLHILGYDHIKPEEEKIMFALQDKILTNLNILRT